MWSQFPIQAPCLIAVGFALCAPGSQTAAQSLPAWSEEAESGWWAAHPEPEERRAGRDEILGQLRTAAAEHGIAAMVENPSFTGWMLLARWLSLSDGGSGELGKNLRARGLLLSVLAPEDDGPRAVEILAEIASEHPDLFARYTDLAVAFAVVHDQPLPKHWPHPFVDQAKIPMGTEAAERFRVFAGLSDDERTEHDLRGLSVRDLVFVVDTPLEFKELSYAHQIDLESANHLRQLHAAVPYDEARLKARNLVWPGASYRLIDVGRAGGICMDQAYFVAQVGKAQGIPTLLFTGQGYSGDHAWVGFVNRNGDWELDVAKIRSEHYPVGQAIDPQTWLRMTDAELDAMVGGVNKLRSRLRPVDHWLAWAAMHTESEDYLELLAGARRAAPQDPRAWRLGEMRLAEGTTDPATRFRFWSEWARAFSQNDDLRARGQIQMLIALQDADKQTEADRLRDQLLANNRNERFDLGIAIAAQPVFRLVRAGRWEEAAASLDAAMESLGADAGGHLFYNLLEPFISTALEEGETGVARRAARFLDGEFKVVPNSLLDADLTALKAAVAR